MSIAVHTDWIFDRGFEGIRLANGLISLVMVPALGGRITSLQDVRSGREWLWKNPRAGLAAHSNGASYVAEANEGGWDECFPTVAPCNYPLEPWCGANVPDHGELWCKPWTLATEHSAIDGSLSLHTTVDGTTFPYRFERTVSLRPGSPSVHFDYRLSSTGDDDLAFIWSAHPLFSVEPGMELHVPGDLWFHTFAAMPPNILSSTKAFHWPPPVHIDGRYIDLSELPVALGDSHGVSGFAFKIWSDPLPSGGVSFKARDGSLHFIFDHERVLQLGVWLNLGGWAGDGGDPFYHLAIEPCIGSQDSLYDAVETFDAYCNLPARGTRDWSFEVELEDRPPGS